jgi:hypothetical protein
MLFLGWIMPLTPRFLFADDLLRTGPGGCIQCPTIHHTAEMTLSVDWTLAAPILAPWIFPAMSIDALLGVALEDCQHCDGSLS